MIVFFCLVSLLNLKPAHSVTHSYLPKDFLDNQTIEVLEKSYARVDKSPPLHEELLRLNRPSTERSNLLDRTTYEYLFERFRQENSLSYSPQEYVFHLQHFANTYDQLLPNDIDFETSGASLFSIEVIIASL